VFGLVFGINAWLALGLQTVLTLVVVEDIGLELPIATQFVVYGALNLFIAAAFAGFIAVKIVNAKRKKNEMQAL
jgi:thiamine transporter 2/3